MEINLPNPSATQATSRPENDSIRLPEDFFDNRLHLELSRSRILGNLGRTTHPSHRAMLERALEAIEKRLTQD